MNDMVERVARALFERKRKHNRPTWASWECQCRVSPVPDIITEYRARARAAIEAMREPTGEMIDAGAETLMVYNEPTGWAPSIDSQPSKSWRAMIDAALTRE